jgi:hypothetical protein
MRGDQAHRLLEVGEAVLAAGTPPEPDPAALVQEPGTRGLARLVG